MHKLLENRIADKHAPVNVFKRHTSVQDVEATMAQMDKQNKTSFTKWVKSENNLNYICTFKAELIKDFIEKDFESSIHALEWMTDGWSLESVSELILKLFYTKRISSAIFCRIVWGLAHSWELEKINDLLPVILVGESLSIIAAFVGNWVNISTMGSDNIAELVVGLACAFRWDIDQLEEFLLSLCAFICSDSVLQRSLCLIVHEELEYAYKAAIADPSKKILYTFEMLVQILIEESTK
ncbi:hypothetical protein HK103_005363 [Boothiomyces macroporosus]|uniref:Uncharacterized protein n=1 Tax=Boothiomyces macroporosus TaxID=261099 RepID=A0AAD5UQE8_9FUNG|nr:hypothetical protein HK103_005363 [Boothiomyces macroporosus]